MEATPVGIKDKLRIILTGDKDSNIKTSQSIRKIMTPKNAAEIKPEKVIDLATAKTGSHIGKMSTHQVSMVIEANKQKDSSPELMDRTDTPTFITLKPVSSAITVEETKQDEYFSLRVETEHSWQRMSPHYVKLSLAAKLKTANSAIEKLTVVNSGFAITAASEAARNLVFQETCVLKDLDMKLEPASKWASVLTANVPDRQNTLNGIILVTAEMVSEDTSLKNGVRLNSLRAFVSLLERPASDWILYFATGTSNLGERLFEKSGRLVKLERRPWIT
ncbi:putative eka-like protein [Erysiphe necator]|uniref:Putative eka-like protein n=1 Tax=Uncinula necator TaxID=52586 RepID=A0A0B1P7X1_UNCNE|nr:putative eka-like protein [Erysiphe necator]